MKRPLTKEKNIKKTVEEKTYEKIEKTRQSIQWTPGYTFEWKVVIERLYKSNKIA